VQGVQGPIGYPPQEAESAQELGPLRVLSHGLPRQGDRCKVFSSDQVSAASLAETGSALRGLVKWTAGRGAAGARGPNRRNG
jgi:hypothetical protein